MSKGQGRKGGNKEAGPGGYCVCPSCGFRTEHEAGEPCYEKDCPECGEKMARE